MLDDSLQQTWARELEFSPEYESPSLDTESTNPSLIAKAPVLQGHL